jgi:predicted AAA+ superfamily ATPase
MLLAVCTQARDTAIMKVRRVMEAVLLDCAREYPALTVFGPRQSGKTTLVHAVFAH